MPSVTADIPDAAEHNRIVHGILKDHGAKSLIKSKSMLTEECGFRAYMASVGIEVIETDLGERFQQLDNEDPSHVIVPAVHKLRTDVAEVFFQDPRHSPSMRARPLPRTSKAFSSTAHRVCAPSLSCRLRM